ncbi:MAG: aminotransferase class I/II-fold pyridoxal phosphate-dependent enzyme [Bacteroidetes bacterium]|nr:aminotransferase class I/II-fold pyridoxal phosphate-dependent enzyme [Bacteroidota bacterium]MCY4234245.1 aminotransferase class I/II-fold pyridoxal phosphate-dependent enzyme [Bacteroidota bacterium]
MTELTDTLPTEIPLLEKTRAFAAPGALLNEAKNSGLYPYFRAISHNEGTRAFIDGQELIMAGSNNYLGLTSDPRVKEAATNAIAKYGTGCTGSRFLNGTLDLHLELEEKLAAFMHKDACILFSTGYMTNMGAIQGITSKSDIIFSDKDNHACIVAGTQVSDAKCWRFRHFDMNHLRRLLQKADLEQPESDKLIVTDGVFSMSGRIAPVPELVKLAKEFDAALMLDDAHAVGVIGPGGRGSAAYFGLGDEVPMTTGTFSKSFASLGGFVTGDTDVIEYIRHMSNAHIFSASMPPSTVATVLKCLEILQEEPWRLNRLWEISNYMRDGFRNAGFDVWNSQAPIIPVVIGEDDMLVAFEFWNDLLQEGVFVNPVVPWRGAVSGGLCIMRTSYMATHTDEDLDTILEAFYRVGRKHGILNPHVE